MRARLHASRVYVGGGLRSPGQHGRVDRARVPASAGGQHPEGDHTIRPDIGDLVV
jgi:hypothetical protein